MSRRSNAPVKPPAASTPAQAHRMDPAVALPSGFHWFAHPGVICALLAVITLGVFWQAGRADFVNYDDADYVSANLHVQSGLTGANVAWAFTSGHASNWHPLTWLSHMLDCQLFGTEPSAMHRVNVALHVLNVVLLFVVLRRMTGAHWRSAIVAALFGLHPLRVESVAWISERKDVLSGLFFVLTLYAYTRYIERTPAARTRTSSLRQIGFFILALFFFALGLMSKPMLVTLPFVLLLLDFWPFGRMAVTAADTASESKSRKIQLSRFGYLAVEKLPFFALAAASSVVTFFVQRKGGAVSTSLPLGGRLANAAVSYARYLGKTFWPGKLSVLYPHPGYWPVIAVVAATLLLGLIFALILWQWRARPYLAVGWLWFFGTLVPVIGLVQVGIQSMADRYTYIPSIGLLLGLVWVLTDIGLPVLQPARAETGRTESLQPIMTAVTVAWGLGVIFVLVICIALTVRQLGYWRNSETLFLHAVQVTPKNYLAYNNLGFYLSNQGRSAEAMNYYQKSLAINPNYEDALNNVGYALAGQKKYREAIGYYQAALKVRPNQVEVHNNLGNALSETGQINEAIQEYLYVLRANPEHADAHNNLGIALAMQGRLDDAIAHFRDAIRYKPKYASAHSNLGNALAVQRKFDEATREYNESLRLNPNDAQAHNNLGNVLSELGRLDEAISHYREALRLNSDNPEAHFNLGLALARTGQRPQALAHLNEALRLKPDYAEARKQIEALTAADPGTSILK